METLRTRVWKSTSIKVSLFLVLISFLIMNGCGGLGNVIPTPDDRTPATPTSTICPTIYLATPGSLENAPVLVVFLIQEGSPNNPWEFTDKAYDIVDHVLPSVSEPGDSFLIFRLGPQNFDDALIYTGQVGNVSQPSIPSTLTPWPTVTTTTTPTTPTPQEPIYQTATGAVASNTQVVIDSSATAISILNMCGEQVWNRDYAEVATEWQVTRQAAKNAFGTQTSNINPGNSNGVIQNQVYEGLDHATRAFNAECNSKIYKRCMLIIFSDLIEWRPTSPQFDVPINLNGVDVMSVLLNCTVLFSPDCTATQKTWSGIFKSFGANSSTFINGDQADEKLIHFIRS